MSTRPYRQQDTAKLVLDYRFARWAARWVNGNGNGFEFEPPERRRWASSRRRQRRVKGTNDQR